MNIKSTSYQIQVKIFEMAGCVFVRTRGDHLIYRHPGAIRPVIIPMYREVPVFVIKNNMKVIGLSRERYLELLQSV
ncbi:putative periplasmic or secreted lipoprotein [uncultured Desulfobacterium sp.]|uniref:Putative periplasmic or secreted lipoprotein n=1 Tax=uncultured Desulfobacterium sp. TaxID=201089 RepID=A0A445MZX7_9BACT|nr:putative periplasmic or secreted lipoprotein [uncultured Desulfobacterium sp.]